MKKLVVLWFFTLGFLTNGISQNTPLTPGETFFQQGDYVSALSAFQKILTDPAQKAYHGPAYFWISKTYLALIDYPNAEKNLEYFLLNYPKDPLSMEAEYQKGRLLFYQGEYEKSLVFLNAFLKKYGENAYTANTLFWLGESAFNLGHFTEASGFFNRVVTSYPSSFKVEAARYRLALIDLKNREEELIKLLKWSHEESLNALDEFQRREKSYQQAILSYQGKIKDLQSGDTGKTIAAYEKRIADLESQLRSGKPATTSTVSGIPSASSSTTLKLLEIKEKALTLKEFYINWMEKNAASAKK